MQLSAFTQAEPRHTSDRLLNILGAGFGVAVAIGNAIAAGIVRTPGEVAVWLPNVWAFLGVWFLGGTYALLGANALAELGTMIPGSGGQYVFSRRALGNYAGFLVGWSDWLSTCGSTATAAVVIGEYVEVLVPAFMGRRVGIALAAVIIFALLQWRGLRWGSRAQNITSFLKGTGFVLLVAIGFLIGNRAPSQAPTSMTDLPLLGVMFALQAVIYTYDGWSGPVYFSEEVRDSGRNVPRALFLGCLAILGIYLSLNALLVFVLPLERIAGDKFALGKAAGVLFGPQGDAIVRTLMIVSMLAGINAYHLMASRVLFGLSRDGLCHQVASHVNPGGTPSVALLSSAVMAVMFVLWSGTFQRLIAVMSFFFVANYTMSFTSLFILRRREPLAPRPFLAWGHPWTTGLVLIGSLAFLSGAVAGDATNSLWALGCLAVSYPVYRLTRRTLTDA